MVYCQLCGTRTMAVGESSVQKMEEVEHFCWKKPTTGMAESYALTPPLVRKPLPQRQAEESMSDEGISLGFDMERLDCDDFAGGVVLGVGGFGTVHQAFWKGRKVAVKMCHEGSRDRNTSCTALWREARICSSLSHPHVVQFLGITESLSDISLVMEYCAGGSLSTLLARKSPLPPTTQLTWAQQIADAMHYLHNCLPDGPIIHSDLKSANVLLSQVVDINDEASLANTVAKVCDFGLARLNSEDVSASQSCTGTFPWQSPEVIRRSTFSCASDTWSFGVVFWELLTSEVPYHNIDKWAVAYGVSTQQLQLPIPTTCPEMLGKLIEDCWQYNPSDRPAFTAVRERLSEIIANFAPVERECFASEQSRWRLEIADVFDELRAKEEVLRSREQEIRETEVRQAELRSDIRKKRQALQRREFRIHDREIEIAMMESEQDAEVTRRTSSASRRVGFFQFLRRLGQRSPMSEDRGDAIMLPLLDCCPDEHSMSDLDDGFDSVPPSPTDSNDMHTGFYSFAGQ